MLRVLTTVGIIDGDAVSGSVCIIRSVGAGVNNLWVRPSVRPSVDRGRSLAEDVWRARQQQTNTGLVLVLIQ